LGFVLLLYIIYLYKVNLTNGKELLIQAIVNPAYKEGFIYEVPKYKLEQLFTNVILGSGFILLIDLIFNKIKR